MVETLMSTFAVQVTDFALSEIELHIQNGFDLGQDILVF